MEIIITLHQIQAKRYPYLHAVFIDLQKTTDRVSMSALWTILGKFGCPRELINIITSFYTDSRIGVIVDKGATEDFKISTWVRPKYMWWLHFYLIDSWLHSQWFLTANYNIEDSRYPISERWWPPHSPPAEMRNKMNNGILKPMHAHQVMDDLVVLNHIAKEMQQMVDTLVVPTRCWA